MSIDRDDVEHIAELARIRLDDDEIEAFQDDLEDILEYVETLEALDTEDVEPTTHAIPLEMEGHADERREELEHEDVLNNAPECEEGHFRVPKVVDDE